MAGGHRGPFAMRDSTVHMHMLKAAFGFGSSGGYQMTRTALVRNRVRIGNGGRRKRVVLTPNRHTRLGGGDKQLAIGRISTGLSTM